MKVVCLFIYLSLLMNFQALLAQTIEERVEIMNQRISSSEAFLKYEPLVRLFFFEKMNQRRIERMAVNDGTLQFYASDRYYTIYPDSVVDIISTGKSVIVDVGCNRKDDSCAKVQADKIKNEGQRFYLPPKRLNRLQLFFKKKADKKVFYNELSAIISDLKK